jgi:hypothetical protein
MVVATLAYFASSQKIYKSFAEAKLIYLPLRKDQRKESRGIQMWHSFANSTRSNKQKEISLMI